MAFALITKKLKVAGKYNSCMATIVSEIKYFQVISNLLTTNMQSYYCFDIENPSFDKIGHVVATADLNDKHDRSAPSNYHWKILKCRMLIFSNSSILACPDKKEIKQVHIIISTVNDDYDRLTSLFMKFSLIQDGAIRQVTPEMFLMCFRYTMTARIAPTWNTIGYNYLINNRNFLSTSGPQDDSSTVLELKPIKIILIHSDENYKPGDCVRVFPSLNKAIIEEYCETLPESGSFKCYQDLRRHWKNIHGYRIPEGECSYYRVRFWCGEPLTYPKLCLTQNFPIITPMPKSAEEPVLSRFLATLKSKMPYFLGISLVLKFDSENRNISANDVSNDTYTQAVSLCTPTQLSTQQNN